MTKSQKSYLNEVFVFILVAVAITARLLGINGFFPTLCGLVRSTIYIFLMIVWGISVRTRVVQFQVRRYLTFVSMLSILWLVLRTIKFYFIPVSSMARPVWYMYYLPMLFIPLLSVFIAMSLGRSENYRLPKGVLLLAIPTLLLL